MPTAVARDQGKSAFVKQVLFEDQYANAAKINDLWAASGQDGSISTSLVNKLRSDLELTGNLRGRRGESAGAGKKAASGKKRGRPRKAAAAAAAPDAPAAAPAYRGRNARQNRLVDIEADIDRLLFKIMGVDGLSDVEDSLRRVRRTVSRAIG
jgi:hypothetical protein